MALLRMRRTLDVLQESPGFPINMPLESATFINGEDNSRHYRIQAVREDGFVKSRHVLLLGSVYIQNIRTYKLFIQSK